MRRLLLGCAAGFLVCTAAWAEGPIVRWDQVIGVTGHESSAGLIVNFIEPTPRWITVRDGRVMLNLQTGFVSINVEGVSYARHYGYPSGGGAMVSLGAPIPASTARSGTFVCNASTASPVQVDTDSFYIVEGSASYRGFLAMVPAECLEHPDDITFLLRSTSGSPAGSYIAFGAARKIQ